MGRSTAVRQGNLAWDAAARKALRGETGAVLAAIEGRDPGREDWEGV
jgi:hypothetical protein